MKYLIIGLIATIFFISFSSAVSVSLQASYEPLQSVIVNMSGNFLSNIKAEQIEFKRSNVLVPLEYDVKKIDNNYYLWFIAPSQKGNYTLLINDIDTTVNGKQTEVDFKQDFEISGNTSDYNIKPGAIMTQEDFSIDVFSFKDEPMEILVGFDESKSITLQPGENKIKFSTGDIEETTTLAAKIGKYEVPVRIIVISTKKNESSNESDTEVKDFRVLPVFIFRELSPADRNVIYPIMISNEGEERISNVFISYDKNYFAVTPEELKDIAPGQEMEVNLTIKNILNASIKKTIFVDFGKKVIPITVMLNLSSSSNATASNGMLYYCDELGGVLCSASEICNGLVKASYDGNCCIGKCSAEEAASSSGFMKIIGWLIAGIVVIGGIILFLKYKKAAPSLNILDKTIGAVKK